MKDIKGKSTDPIENPEEVQLKPEAMRLIVEVCVNAVLRGFYADKENQKVRQEDGEEHESEERQS